MHNEVRADTAATKTLRRRFALNNPPHLLQDKRTLANRITKTRLPASSVPDQAASPSRSRTCYHSFTFHRSVTRQQARISVRSHSFSISCASFRQTSSRREPCLISSFITTGRTCQPSTQKVSSHHTTPARSCKHPCNTSDTF